jgi:peptide/nickel transport system ATP-binding protein
MADAARPPVLEVRGLTVDYVTSAGSVVAASSVDLCLRRGEFVGLAGESGCGKSTLALAISRLLPPAGGVVSGSITFTPPDGSAPIEVLDLAGAALRDFRWRRISMVFQSAMNSFNPVMTMGAQLADAIRAHDRSARRRDLRKRSTELLELVGVAPRHLRSYPHELSGGMRQRVMLAMALALHPDVVLMDEPTTSLDVVVQREILDQIRALQSALGFAILFITHDLSLLLDVADRVLIMYGGEVVEEAAAESLIDAPAHPYTVGLLGSFPELRGPRRELGGIPGAPPDLTDLPVGCLFAPRCPSVQPDCVQRRPLLERDPRAYRSVACFHPAGANEKPDLRQSPKTVMP